MYSIELVGTGGAFNSTPVDLVFYSYTKYVGASLTAVYNRTRTFVRFNSLINFKTNLQQPNFEYSFIKNKIIKEFSLEYNIKSTDNDTTNTAEVIQRNKLTYDQLASNYFRYSVIRIIKNKTIVFENTIDSFINKSMVLTGSFDSVTPVPQSVFNELGMKYVLKEPIEINENDEFKCEVILRAEERQELFVDASPGEYSTNYRRILSKLALKME